MCYLKYFKFIMLSLKYLMVGLYALTYIMPEMSLVLDPELR